MRKNKLILKAFLLVMLSSILLTTHAVSAIAEINSLDFSLTGLKAIDCKILGSINLERDPSWTNEEFYAHLIDEYVAQTGDTDINVDLNYLGDINTYDVIANYCASDEDKYITTTYGDYGYSGFIKLNGREVAIDDENLIATDSGYLFHEDGFADMEIKLIRIDATMIQARYILKNLTGLATDFGVAFYTDIELGENDNAAISKTDHTFTITQDDYRYDSTFGAKFMIDLSPTPTTSFIGQYVDAEDLRWTNSPRDYYTAADGVDTGLSYSWQGQIDAGGTKTFSATYTIDIAETFLNNFYYLSNDYAEPIKTLGAVDSGALRLPNTDLSSRAGWHRDWNSKSDGSGTLFKSGLTIIADKNRNNYYEVEVPNEVLPDVEPGWKNFEEKEVIVTDELESKFQALADASYSDVRIYAYINEIPDEYIEDLTADDGPIDLDEILNAAGEGYNFGDLFQIDEVGYEYRDADDYWHENPLDEEDFPVTIRIKLLEDFTDNKANFGVVRISCDYDSMTCDTYETLPTRYNSETRELFIEVDSNGSYVYALTYTEIPKVPDTGASTTESNLAEVSICAPVMILVAVAIKKLRQK